MHVYHVYPREREIDIVYHPDEPGGTVWSGTVELHRGAPAADSHPELLHAFLSIGDHPELHAEFIRHRWEADIPDFYEGLPNTGDARRYLTLTASGAEINWSLVLKLPLGTPRHVYKRLIAAFRATMKGDPVMKSVSGNDMTPKTAMLKPQPVPKADPVPSATQAGIKSITSQG